MKEKALVLIFSFLVSLLGAQEAVVNPFAIRLMGSQVENTIVLTWRDSPSFADGSVHILRYFEEITNDNLAMAEEVGSVPHGTQRYEDVPPNSGTFFYAVVGTTAEGERYDQVAIYRNTMIDGISFLPVEIEPEVPELSMAPPGTTEVEFPAFILPRMDLQAPLPEVATRIPQTNIATLPEDIRLPSIPEPPSVVEDTTPDPIPDEVDPLDIEPAFEVASITLSIQPTNSGFTLSYQADKNDREYAIYRSTSPINDLDSLENSVVLGILGSDRGIIEDIPPAGIDLYYAVVDTLALNQGFPDLLNIDNTTQSPFRLEIVEEAVESIASFTRRLPLPRINLTSDPVTGEVLENTGLIIPPELEISYSTRESLEALIAEAPATPGELPEISRFIDDTFQSEGTNGRFGEILEEFFETQDWSGGIAELEDLLGASITGEWRYRGQFYLAQAYAKIGDYRQALSGMIYASSYYPSETEPWLEALFGLVTWE